MCRISDLDAQIRMLLDLHTLSSLQRGISDVCNGILNGICVCEGLCEEDKNGFGKIKIRRRNYEYNFRLF